MVSVWGSSQLSGQPRLLPNRMANRPSVQTVAAEAEDFDQAAALDDRIAEASRGAAEAGAEAQREERRAEELARRRAELVSQQQQVRAGAEG